MFLAAQIDPTGTRQDLLGDGLGSVRSISDSRGVWLAPRTTPCLANTALRTVSPVQDPPGRGFLSADPVQPNAPGTQGYNLYAYVANNPTTWVDPSGYSVASLFESDLELLSNLYAMGMGMGDILECMVDEECKNMHTLINDLGAQTYNTLEWSAEGLYNVFFSTYPHQPTPVSPAALVFSLTVSNTPVVGDLYDLVTAVIGYDIITGQYLAGWERLVTLIGVIPIPGVSGGILSHGMDAVDSFASYGDDLARVVGGVGEACRINSFSEETPVVTDEGAIPIKDVDVGERVLAWDKFTETTDYYLVTAAFSHVDATMVELTIDGEVIETTAD
ncbi:MAG: hypothetical protein KDE31_27200, partial [Caldilineaceae bacterium]|nr:hypothetical protein [Caldilineaceae bacterium]